MVLILLNCIQPVSVVILPVVLIFKQLGTKMILAVPLATTRMALSLDINILILPIFVKGKKTASIYA